MKTLARPRAQRGAILVTSLLLLLILTVLGVAMMRVTNMQERMASNTRDLNTALQAAEMAVRQGENTIDTWVSRPISSSTAGCTLCQSSALPLAIYDTAQFNWANAQAFTATGEATNANLKEAPRYVLEELGFVPDSLDRGYEPSEPGRDVYQVTSRSTGVTGFTNTVLQATFTKRH